MDPFIRILHLEDDPADAKLVQGKIEEAGMACRITLVQTRDEYDEELRRNRYDVILADYRLPMYDGMSALRVALELRPDVPFIFVSGTMGEEAEIEGLTEGAADYVLKQRLLRLAPAVKRALNEAENRRERKRRTAQDNPADGHGRILDSGHARTSLGSQ
jgi:phosphoserine phosphatase RsbU/P